MTEETETEENCLGITILDNIVVEYLLNGEHGDLELQIEPAIVMHGQAAELAPGVTYNPEFYTEHAKWFGEIIAYAINEGATTADTIEDEECGNVTWQVRHDCLPILHKYGLVSR